MSDEFDKDVNEADFLNKKISLKEVFENSLDALLIFEPEKKNGKIW